MDEPIVYRGRTINAEDIAFLGDLIEAHPTATRRKLSVRVCEAWDWRQANGALRDMVCRGLMLWLHRAGHIELPARKFTPRNPRVDRRGPPTDIRVDQDPIGGPLRELQPLEFRQVRRSNEERLFNGLIERDHYLGYTQPVGEPLKYVVYAKDRPAACLGWSSAPWHIGPRDRFIGWTPAVRRRTLHWIAYNTRYLILPWVQVPHLASHILGQMARRLSADWEPFYGHPIYDLETFVDRDRFAGTCYRAANWRYLGQPTGRGKKDKTHQVTRSLKDVLGYPLGKDFRRRLCKERADEKAEAAGNR